MYIENAALKLLFSQQDKTLKNWVHFIKIMVVWHLSITGIFKNWFWFPVGDFATLGLSFFFF